MINIIDFETVRSVLGEVDPSEMLKWIRWGFEHKDEFQMPPKTRLSQPEGDYYACMPCMHGELDIAIAKMVGRHARVARKLDMPAMTSDVLCYKASSGELLALVDGEYITTVRTGACAAFSALQYAKRDFKTMGLIGLGNIMTSFMEVFVSALGDRPITVKLYRHNGQEDRLVKKFGDKSNLNFEFCKSYDQVVSGSDVIVSAVTRAEGDFCDVGLYKNGCTVIPIMTLGFQNCDTCFEKVFTDEVEQIRGFKYFNSFKSLANTDDVLAGRAPGRENDDERIIVYNYGLATLDLIFISKLLELIRETDVTYVDYRVCSERFFMK